MGAKASNSIILKLIVLIFIGIGVAVLIWGMTESIQIQQLKKNGIKTFAYVQNCERIITEDGSYLLLDIRYDGYEKKGFAPKPIEMGRCPKKPFEVLYDAEKPSKVILASSSKLLAFFSKLFISLFFLGLGGMGFYVIRTG